MVLALFGQGCYHHSQCWAPHRGCSDVSSPPIWRQTPEALYEEASASALLRLSVAELASRMSWPEDSADGPGPRAT